MTRLRTSLIEVGGKAIGLRASLVKAEEGAIRLRGSLVKVEKKASLIECRVSEVTVEVIEAF